MEYLRERKESMGETSNTTESTKKKSFFQGMKAEYSKIIWATKQRLAEETVNVVVASVVLGLIIALLDLVIKYGFDKILQIG